MHLFWQMVWENDVDQIVMLTELFEESEGELCHPYWPEEIGQPLHLANEITVALLETQELLPERHESILIRKFHIYYRGVTKQITHYWYRHWPDNTAPKEAVTLLTLIDAVQKNKNSSAPILVHCCAGVGRTGVFTTLYHSFQRKIRNEAPIDLLEFTAWLRWQRTKLLALFSQYCFCYNTLQILSEVHTTP